MRIIMLDPCGVGSGDRLLGWRRLRAFVGLPGQAPLPFDRGEVELLRRARHHFIPGYNAAQAVLEDR